TAWGNYTWPLGDRGTLDLFTTVGYTDEYFFNAPFERDLDRTPEFVRWDARVSWTSAARTWEAAAFVNNITNELGVRALQGSGEEANFKRFATTTDPRVFGLSIAYRLSP